MITKLFTYAGDQLIANFSTSAPGSLRFTLEDPSGAKLAASAELIGDEISRPVRWQEGANLGQWAGQPVRLRVALKDADLYAIQFGRT